MISIISFIAYIVAAIIYFTNGQMILFYLSVTLLIITYAVNAYVRHYRVAILRKIFDDTVGQMEADGCPLQKLHPEHNITTLWNIQLLAG